MDIASLIVVAVGTWLAASFLQATLHMGLAHRPWGGLFFHAHVGCHHKNYQQKYLSSASYIEDKLNLSPWFVLPVSLIIGAAYTVLPIEHFIVHVVVFCLSYLVHIYLHGQYHVSETWLEHFAWFRRRRLLHYEHHLDMSCNFAVIDFFWDKLMGTFRDPRRSMR